MKTNNSLCLNMIVKNESQIIEQTLINLCNYINFTYWVICDTGSTDNTVWIINNFFSKKNIPGEICHHVWKDFGHNRTIALQAAYNKTDFLFIFDADDSINGKFEMPKLEHDWYNVFFGSTHFKYVRPLIINNRKRWKFKGILHEYLTPLEHSEYAKTIEGDYFITSGKGGARSKNPNKYLDDANLFKKEIECIQSTNNHPDADLLPRYTYYCANSYRDSNESENAILYYKKVFECDTWIQEKYNSALAIGNIYENLNNIEEAINYWYKAILYDKERRESILKIMDYYFKNENYFALNCLYEKIKDFKIQDISSKLFLDISRYDDVHYLNSIGACYISEWMSGYYSCKYLILNDLHIEMTLYNFKCYAYNIHLDSDNKLFLDKLLSLFKYYFNTKKSLIEELWLILSKHIKNVYNLDSIHELVNEEQTNLQMRHKISKKESTDKILIYTGFMNFLWNESTIKEKSIGGSEKAIVYLSKYLPKKYKIYIAGDQIEEEIDNIKYVNHNNLQTLLDTEKFHTIIISRYISFFEKYCNFKCFQLFLLAHDTVFISNYGTKSADNILNDNIQLVDGIVCLTEWHKDIILHHHKSCKDVNIILINNGINLPDFENIHDTKIENKIKNKFVWSSCSERGIHILLELWPLILEKLPDATLDICSYNTFPNSEYDTNVKKIIDNFDSIVHHGQLNSDKLYKLLSLADYWLYTNTFPETSCITAMEMLINEVVCLYYPNAGLVNTIGDYGIKVESGNEIDSILNLSEEQKNVLRKNGKEYALSCSWENRAQEWINMLNINI
jgi:tetratricopeptide (TPR) repeat protein